MRKEFKRYEILETVRSWSPYQLDGSVDDVIDMLSAVKAEAEAKGWFNVRIEVEYYYDDCNVNVYANRLETDKEYEARWEEHKKRLAAKKLRAEKEKERAARKIANVEAEERALLAKLKAKYGSD